MDRRPVSPLDRLVASLIAALAMCGVIVVVFYLTLLLLLMP